MKKVNKTLVNSVSSQTKNEKGATMVEYVVLLSLIAAVCTAAVMVLGEDVSEKFSEVATAEWTQVG